MAQGQTHTKNVGQVGKAKAGMTRAPEQQGDAKKVTTTEHGERQFAGQEGARRLEGTEYWGPGGTLAVGHQRNVERITSPLVEMIQSVGMPRRQEDSILATFQAVVGQLEAYFMGDETQQIRPIEAHVPSAHA